MAQTLSQRARVRAETTEQIKRTARRILVQQGPDAVTLRAIARDMGMTAPALYRYFGSHEDLLRHLAADIFTELADDILAAIAHAGAAGDGMAGKLVAACQEFRRWSLAHRPEFGLIFGNPLPGVDAGHGDITAECGRRFAGTFLSLILDLWRQQPFPVPADDEISPTLRDQLSRYRDSLAVAVPLGVTQVFLDCWVRLYGIVSLEVFGHLGFVLDDATPMFEITLSQIAPLLGLRYPPPR